MLATTESHFRRWEILPREAGPTGCGAKLTRPSDTKLRLGGSSCGATDLQVRSRECEPLTSCSRGIAKGRTIPTRYVGFPDGPHNLPGWPRQVSLPIGLNRPNNWQQLAAVRLRDLSSCFPAPRKRRPVLPHSPRAEVTQDSPSSRVVKRDSTLRLAELLNKSLHEQ